MSRTPEVEKAMRNTESGLYCTDDADTLAAEIERLEKRLDHSHEVWRNEHDRAKAAETRYDASQGALTEAMGELREALERVAELEAELIKASERVAKVTRIMYAEHIEKMKELEAQNQALTIITRNEGWAIGTALGILSDGAGSCYSDKLPEWATKRMSELKEAQAQNARLREESASLAAQLAECAGYIASVRTDRQLTRDGDVYALQTLDWAEGALGIAEKANAALEAYDEALAETKGTPTTADQIMRDHICAVAAEMRQEADEYKKLAQGSTIELAEFRLRIAKILNRFADRLEGRES